VFETELRQAGVPYVLIGGMSFFDRREVRDLLAYLRVIHNPQDEPSLRRILNQPPRGISDVVRKRVTDAALASSKPLWDFLPQVGELEGIPPKSVDAINRFCALIRDLQCATKSKPIDELVKEVIERIDYYAELQQQYPEPQERESRVAALEGIVNAAASFEQKQSRSKSTSRVGEFLDELMLGERDDSDEKDAQLARNAVALMTLHSAKGLEFPHVYMVGLEEGILPHKRSLEIDGDAIDEERRLCYVGVTRAQDQLTLSFALTRRKWGKPRETQPSRFLFEMTGQADNPKSPGVKSRVKQPLRANRRA
jgi:DNA helicase-2/ATP-dependent DNA helicase PcrA